MDFICINLRSFYASIWNWWDFCIHRFIYILSRQKAPSKYIEWIIWQILCRCISALVHNHRLFAIILIPCTFCHQFLLRITWPIQAALPEVVGIYAPADGKKILQIANCAQLYALAGHLIAVATFNFWQIKPARMHFEYGLYRKNILKKAYKTYCTRHFVML